MLRTHCCSSPAAQCSVCLEVLHLRGSTHLTLLAMFVLSEVGKRKALVRQTSRICWSGSRGGREGDWGLEHLLHEDRHGVVQPAEEKALR